MPTALTIGTFDGVHRGHAALVRRARELAGRGRVIALAFDPHPMTALRPEAAPERLTTFERREALLRAQGADEVVQLKPEPSLLSKSPEDFLRWATDHYHPNHIIEGDDFHFGRARAGTINTLRQLGPALGFQTDVVPPVELALSDDLIVRASSSITRWLLKQGRVRDAALVLGRPYELDGTVTKGDQRGRELGFPTANLDTPCLLPADGVYAATAQLESGETIPAAANVGTRPTFNGAGRRIEAHLLDWSPPPGHPDYNWNLTLRLHTWLRDDMRFESMQPLIDQIIRDCDRTRKVLNLQKPLGAT